MNRLLVEITVIALVIASALAYVFWQRQAIWQEGYDKRSAEIKTAVAEQNTIEAAKQGVVDTQLAEQGAKHEQDKQAAARALKSATQERDGLRAAIDNSLRSFEARAATGGQACQNAATSPGADDTTARLGQLFEQCSGKLQGMAGNAEQLAGQVRGLQGWVRTAESICVSK